MKIIFAFMLLLFSTCANAQFLIKELNKNGTERNVDLDSVISRSVLSQIDSTVLTKLYIPKELDYENTCEECGGSIFYAFIVKGDSLKQVKLLRGIDNSFIDSIMFNQHMIAYDGIRQHLKLDHKRTYSIVVHIFLERNYDQDSIYIKQFPGYPTYTIRKRILTLELNPDYKNFEKVPKDINESIQEVDSLISVQCKDWIKQHSEEYFLRKAHFGLGQLIRNKWGLWGNSQLAGNFNSLGIFHPDDMSSIILACYYRHLTNQEIDLQAQISYYIEYWDRIKNN